MKLLLNKVKQFKFILFFIVIVSCIVIIIVKSDTTEVSLPIFHLISKTIHRVNALNFGSALNTGKRPQSGQSMCR